MGTRLLCALVILLAILSGARLLTVGFLEDDWLIVTHVHRHGNASSWTEPWLGTTGANFHRPLFTGLYALEYQLFGADPLPGHVHHLLWHVLATGLVFVLVRQLGGGSWGATLGALLFAWNPHHAVSLGWLASRTGTVASTLTLLALVCWLRHRRQPAAWAYGLALLAAVTAALTKESGYLAFLLLPTVDLIWCRPRRPNSSLLRDWSPFALCGVGLLVLRYVALGTLGGGYGQPDGLLAGGEIAAHSVRAFGDACWRLLCGVPREYLGELLPSGLGDWPWASYLGALMTLLILRAACVAMVRQRLPDARALRVEGRSFVLLVVALLPHLFLLVLVAGPTLDPVRCQRWYGVIGLLSVLLGVGISALPPGLGRIPGAILLILFVLAGHQATDLVLDADRVSRGIIESVSSEMEALPPDCDAVFVSGLPESHDGVPLFWWGLEMALGPPFRKPLREVPIFPIHRNLTLKDAGSWEQHPPVESLYYISGGVPYQIHVEVDGTKVASTAFDYKRRLSRQEAQQGLEAFFQGAPLSMNVLEGTPDVIPADAQALNLEIQPGAAETMHVFCFVPGKDSRIPVPPAGFQIVTDIWPMLRDTATSRGVETRALVLAVGFSEGPSLHLSRLVRISCAPRIPRHAWRRR